MTTIMGMGTGIVTAIIIEPSRIDEGAGDSLLFRQRQGVRRRCFYAEKVSRPPSSPRIDKPLDVQPIPGLP